MMRRLLIASLCLCIARTSWAAIAATTVWEFNASATGSMVNGGGFNPANAASMTDLAGASADTARPDVSSSTYAFVAADVGNWVYISAGTNWTPGYYQIDCVGTGCDPDLTAGHAKLKAAAGEANIIGTYENWTTNTTAGCATTASPTGGTFKIDYSRATAAQDTGDDLASADGDAAPCVVTSATHNFLPNDVGNLLHITETGTGFTVGWYEIVSVETNAATLDRACGANGSLTGGDWSLGGALDLAGALPDAFFEQVIGGNAIWIAPGTYTLSGAISVSATSCDGTNSCIIAGYTTRRGLAPFGSARPLIAGAANAVTFGQYQNVRNLRFTTTASGGIALGGYGTAHNLNSVNVSAAANGYALRMGANGFGYDLDIVSLNGTALSVNTAAVVGAFAHDSKTGIALDGAAGVLVSSLVSHNRTSAVTASQNATVLINSTMYGATTPRGTCLASGTANKLRSINAIIAGCASGRTATALYTSNESDYDVYYNNTTPVTNVRIGDHSRTSDPGFANATELIGSTATTSGQVLTDTGKDFTVENGGIVDGEDYLHVLSGTGVTTGGYRIGSHTATTITTAENALGTSSAGDVVYFVTTGHDFAVGANMKATGWPGPYGTGTTSYLDSGAIQRQEPDTPTPAPTPTWWPATPTPIPTCS